SEPATPKHKVPAWEMFELEGRRLLPNPLQYARLLNRESSSLFFSRHLIPDTYLGTSVDWRMSVITESGVAPSSSASARNVKRCRNTGRAMSRTSSGVEKSRPRIAERAFAHSNNATAARGLPP